MNNTTTVPELEDPLHIDKNDMLGEYDLDEILNRLVQKYHPREILKSTIELCGEHIAAEYIDSDYMKEQLISDGYYIFDDEDSIFDEFDLLAFDKSLGRDHASCFRAEAMEKIEEFVNREGWNKLYDILNEAER